MAEELDEEVLAFARQVFELARSGEAAQLAEYLDAGVPANMTNEKGDTLLILAAYHNHPETVRVLLEHGADHSRANDRGQTALAAAVFRQNAQTVNILLAGGADPNAGGPSALEMANFFNLPEMQALLEATPESR
jgi:ankyrin repeat protein